MTMLNSTNPFTGEQIGQYEALSPGGVTERIGAAREAFPAWRRFPLGERAGVLRAWAGKLRDRKQNLAELMALEMGKPVREGLPEVEKAAWCAEHYADHAAGYLADEALASDASHSYVTYRPLGTLLGILPWNAPLWLASRYLAPALMAGNTCVLKHDPHVQGCAAAIEETFRDIGEAPANMVVNLPVETRQVEDAILDPRIAGVSFTGSAVAGSKVAAAAGAGIKPVVLELGGSDPCIVMADADLEQAADVAVLSRMINAGQSCIAAKRVIIESSVYDRFTEMVQERLARLTLGDPLDPATDVGPIARRDLRDNLERQVSETLDAGARCIFESGIPEGRGFFFPVTLLADVVPGMCAFEEETFGPVMVMTPADDLDRALNLANDTPYGLGAAIWTSNHDHMARAIDELESGQIAVNGIVKTDPRLPSGGVKQSGIGRELGPHGIREFVNAKQVWIK